MPNRSESYRELSSELERKIVFVYPFSEQKNDQDNSASGFSSPAHLFSLGTRKEPPKSPSSWLPLLLPFLLQSQHMPHVIRRGERERIFQIITLFYERTLEGEVKQAPHSDSLGSRHVLSHTSLPSYKQ